MKALVARLLQKSAGTGAGALGGMGLAALTTGNPATGLPLLFSALAACLVVDAGVEVILPNEKLNRIETWLEQLVHRFGRLDDAIRAIADGRESMDVVHKESAAALVAFWESQGGQRETAANGDVIVQRVLSIWESRLETVSVPLLENLERQLDQIHQIGTGVQGIDRKTDAIAHQLGVVAAKIDAFLSEDELSERSHDEHDNARLRADALDEAFRQLEFARAATFADRDFKWLERTPKVPFLMRVRLLECCCRAAIGENLFASSEQRGAILDKLRAIIALLSKAAPVLDKTASLRVSSRIAYVESLLVSPEAGLKLLNGRSDPHAVKRRLAILCDSKRFDEAVAMIRGATPSEEWAENAIYAAAHAGEWEEAQRVLDWALTNANPELQQDAKVMFGEAVVLTPTEESPSSDSDAQFKKRCQRAWELLKSHFYDACSNPTPRIRKDCRILSIGVHLAAELEESKDLVKLADALASERPLNSGLALLAVKGILEPGIDWPQRLRLEGPSDFDRLLLAAMIEGKHPTRLEVAFRAAIRLAPLAESTEQRHRLHGVLRQLGQHLGKSIESELETVATALVGAGDRQTKLWALSRRIENGDLEGCDESLTALHKPSDPLWLQIHGALLLKSGRAKEAIASLAEAAQILDLPDQLADVGALALGHKEWEQAIVVLGRLVERRPGDERVRTSLALALHKLGMNEQAIVHLAKLSADHPEDSSHLVNLAACFVKLGKDGEAIAALRQLCERPEPSVHGVVGLAQLLVGDGKPVDAFALVELHRSRFWTDFSFVLAYVSIAYSAQREDAGRKALEQVRALQELGKAPKDALVEVSLDDLANMSKDRRELAEKEAATILRGEMPWLTVAEWRHVPAMRAWSERTRLQKWVLEEARIVASTCIYSSNAFTVRGRADDRELVPIESVPRGTPAVVDLSALITLNQLNILPKAVAFLATAHIPSVYLLKMVTDADGLRFHQPSRRSMLATLSEALARQNLHELAEGESEYVRHVEEFYVESDKPKDVYHLADLYDALMLAQTATDIQLQKLRGQSRRARTVADAHPAIQPHDTVMISLWTLWTIVSCDALDCVLSTFRVVLSSEDRRSVAAETHWFQAQDMLIADHRRLWDTLRDHPNIVRHPEIADEKSEVSDEAGKAPIVGLEAFSLAKRLNVPLLVDDRFLQAALFQERSESSNGAFGTPQLLAAMAGSGAITRAEYAASMRKLIGFRYRFLTIGADLLKFWTDQSLEAFPGPDLLALTHYMHDCFRDPGLFGGQENTTPPSSMGLKLYQATETAVGEFIGIVWNDDKIAETKAATITEWAIANLMPSPPMTMGPRLRPLGDLAYPFFMAALLMKAAVGKDAARSRHGVRFAAEQLGIRPETLVRAAANLTGDIRRRNDKRS